MVKNSDTRPPGLRSTAHSSRSAIIAWSAWDAGSAAFNAVLLTSIFSVYLIDSVGQNVSGPLSASQWYSYALALAGIIIALVTPVMGQRADEKGTRKRAVVVWSLWTVLFMAVLFFVRNTGQGYFVLGVIALAVASITIQFAEVSYFAMINQVSTAENVGKVSGYGWAAGYIAGIVLLLLCYFGFVAGDGPERGFLQLSTEEGLNIRLVALFSAVWFFLCLLPLIFRIPEIPARNQNFRDNFADSYARLFKDIGRLWHNNRNGAYFLTSSAIFRDGLAGVFTYGAILAVTVFDLSAGDVLLFGVAANVVAAIGAFIGGLLDDIVGPKNVILTSLGIMVILGFCLLFAEGPGAFWVFGLLLCLFVGPAQSSARSFVARVATPGYEGQMFGLYTTTGRAVSWLTPLLFATFMGVSGTDERAGIIGIVMVLLIGAVLVAAVRDPRRAHEKPASHPEAFGLRDD